MRLCFTPLVHSRQRKPNTIIRHVPCFSYTTTERLRRLSQLMCRSAPSMCGGLGEYVKQMFVGGAKVVERAP